MHKLYLTTVFHNNLSFSSIPEKKYNQVIKKCYWPILEIVKEKKIKIGLEYPAKTLEIIQQYDNEYIKSIKDLWKKNQIEVIGSSYTQSIFPLIPAKVNQKNLEMGNQVYKQILGKKPTIAYVNEQTYSGGIVELYKNAGYNGLIIDWSNAIKSKILPQSEKYKCGFLNGCGNKIKLIWNDSIAFQKLQRLAYGDISEEEYLNFILKNYHPGKNRCLMIYGSDSEVFNFRPRNPKTLHSGNIKQDEILRIKNIFEKLKNNKKIEFLTPTECILKNSSKNEYKIESAQYPIISKKQDKYNPCRWAVCGKHNSESNRICHEIYNLLCNQKIKVPDDYWEKLVNLWASDYRTHTEKRKWDKFYKQAEVLVKTLKTTSKNSLYSEFKQKNRGKYDLVKKTKKKFVKDLGDGIFDSSNITLKLSKKKGGNIKELSFKKICDDPIISTIPHGYYQDISYSVDFFTGHSIIFEGVKKYTDLGKCEIKTEDLGGKFKIIVKGKINNDITYLKTYTLFNHENRVDIINEYNIIKKIKPILFRTFILTFNPEAFNNKNLYFKTVNGGNKAETFKIEDDINHSQPVDINITSRNCMGSTEGWYSLGDDKKEMIIKTDKSHLYSVPLIEYKKFQNNFFLRVYNSVCETDDTTQTSLSGKFKFSCSIVMERK